MLPSLLFVVNFISTSHVSLLVNSRLWRTNRRCFHPVFSRRCVAWKVCDPASWVSFATVCDRVQEHTPESASSDWSISRLASSPDAFQPIRRQNPMLNTCVHDFNSGHWVQSRRLYAKRLLRVAELSQLTPTIQTPGAWYLRLVPPPDSNKGLSLCART